MKAKRQLGQNFLVASSYVERLIASVSPRAGETILEIGPGHGALTDALVASGAKVTAIELDTELAVLLRARFQSAPNFRLLNADVLALEMCDLFGDTEQVRVVANLPYYISTPILQHLLAYRRCLRELTVMLQREVVERIVAPPGGKEYGFLSVLVQYYCEAVQLFDVPPGAFRPAPKVWSSVVRLRLRETPAAPVPDEALMIELTKVLFSQRRKTIYNNLRAGRARLGLSEEADLNALLVTARLDPQRRAETLTLAETAQLTTRVWELRQP